MKPKLIVLILPFIMLMISCEKEDQNTSQVSGDIKELSDRNLKIQTIRNFNLNSTHRFGAMAMNLKALKKNAQKNDEPVEDSNYWSEWETCAEITNYTDENGFDIMIMDYGTEGCVEFGELIKGKVTWKWKMDENGWIYEDIYENYSAWGMNLNGFYKGKTEWTGTINWDDFEDSTYFYNWFSNDYQEVSTNEEDIVISFDNGEEISYLSNFKSKFTFESYIMMEGDFSYVSNSGDSYTWEIVEPVVTNYNCMYWIPVSGIEEGIENDDVFRIEYGDRTCDNKYTITVNGVTEEIVINDEDIWVCEDLCVTK